MIDFVGGGRFSWWFRECFIRNNRIMPISWFLCDEDFDALDGREFDNLAEQLVADWWGWGINGRIR